MSYHRPPISSMGYVIETIECEGFWQAFQHYHDFNEVEDPKFHELRLAYLNAGKALADYIGADVNS